MFYFNWKKNRSSSVPRTYIPKNLNDRGHALVSYLADPVEWQDDDSRFLGHSNLWESKTITQIFLDLGFTVDVIDYTNSEFFPNQHYVAIFDIYTNLQRIAPFLSRNTIKLLHLTGSYAPFQNHAELSRVADVEKRRSALYSPKRLVRDVELFERSLRFADACSLIGNDVTLHTFPKEYQKKISLVSVSSSLLPKVKKASQFVPPNREFLWFFGGGVVHKGLDIVLEAFTQMPSATLHVIGNVEAEQDFVSIYRNTLFHTPNIHYHGYLLPSSPEFINIANQCVAFLAPSCSESISTAAATCVQYGLYPVVSRATGITLPAGSGRYLHDCTVKEIIHTVQEVLHADTATLAQEIQNTQHQGLEIYSRENFTSRMRSFLTTKLSPTQ